MIGSKGEPGRAANDQDMIDVLLREWASNRDVAVPPGAALAAADAALAEARRTPASQRRWFPAAVFGGSVAAALAGVLVLTPGTVPESAVPAGDVVALSPGNGEPQQFASALPETGLVAPSAGEAAMPVASGNAGGTQLAASDFGPASAPPLDETFPSFDAPPDDLLMTSHVFTTRPDEELIY